MSHPDPHFDPENELLEVGPEPETESLEELAEQEEEEELTLEQKITKFLEYDEYERNSPLPDSPTDHHSLEDLGMTRIDWK